MESNIKKNLIKYGIAFLVGGLLFYLYIYLRDFPSAEAADNWRMLSDAATIPGLLFVMVGALIWAISKGAVDGVSYALTKVFRGLIPGGRFREDETYAEYIDRRHERMKHYTSGYAFLFITGIVFLVFAMFCMIMFYRY